MEVYADVGSWSLRMPIREDTVVPWLEVSSDLSDSLKALIKAPAGEHVLGASETLSLAEWLLLLTSQVGMDVSFEDISLEAFASRNPVGPLAEFAEQMLFSQDLGYTSGGLDMLSPEKVCLRLNRKRGFES